MLYSEGLKKSRDFSRVYREGKSKSNALMVLYACPNGTDRNRLGIVVSKKVGNSVVRHRLKRLVRENYRLNEGCYSRGSDLVVVMRRGSDRADFYAIEASLNQLSRNLGLLVSHETA